MRRRQLVALIWMCSGCRVAISVLCLFHFVSWGWSVWSMIMVFPGHTHVLFWPEWESDLRSSTPQSRTLTTKQWRFLYLVVICVSSSWCPGLWLWYFLATHWLFWSEWESDLRSSTPQSRTLTTRQRRFSYLVVFWSVPHGSTVDWSVIMVFPGHTYLLFGPSGIQNCDFPHLSQGLLPLYNGASHTL